MQEARAQDSIVLVDLDLSSSLFAVGDRLQIRESDQGEDGRLVLARIDGERVRVGRCRQIVGAGQQIVGAGQLVDVEGEPAPIEADRFRVLGVIHRFARDVV